MKMKKTSGGELACAAPKPKSGFLNTLYKHRQLYIMLIPGVLHYIIFQVSANRWLADGFSGL